MFLVSWPFGTDEEALSRFPIGIILAIFGQQVAQILPTKFQVNWPSGSKEFQNGFFLFLALAAILFIGLELFKLLW